MTSYRQSDLQGLLHKDPSASSTLVSKMIEPDIVPVCFFNHKHSNRMHIEPSRKKCLANEETDCQRTLLLQQSRYKDVQKKRMQKIENLLSPSYQINFVGEKQEEKSLTLPPRPKCPVEEGRERSRTPSPPPSPHCICNNQSRQNRDQTSSLCKNLFSEDEMYRKTRGLDCSKIYPVEEGRETPTPRDSQIHSLALEENNCYARGNFDHSNLPYGSQTEFSSNYEVPEDSVQGDCSTDEDFDIETLDEEDSECAFSSSDSSIS